MTHWYVRPRANCAQWIANTAYGVGDRVVCTRGYATPVRRRYVYECTIAGTSHAATQPAWPTSGTIADGGVTWTTRNPTTWANATIFLDYLLSPSTAIITAGDYIWIDAAASITVTDGNLQLGQASWNPGNAKIPTDVISTSDTATEPPTTYDPGATLKSIAHIDTSMAGLHLWGLNLYAGTGASSGTPSFYSTLTDNYATGAGLTLHDCEVYLDYAVTGCQFRTGGASATYGPVQTTLRNTTIHFSHAGQQIRLGLGVTDWRGGGIAGTAPTILFGGVNPWAAGTAVLDALDLTLCTGSLFNAATFHPAHVDLIRCALDSGVALYTGTPPTAEWLGIRVTDCHLDPPPTRSTAYSYAAQLRPNQTIVRTDGYTRFGTPESWRIATTAENNAAAFVTPDITFDNLITGTELTARVQILIDSLTALTVADAWLELSSLDTEDSACATLHTAEQVPLFATTVLEHSDLTWDTPGLTNPQPRALTATFTPAQPGRIAARVRIAKPSATIYVDPVLALYIADDPAPQPDPIPDFPFIMTDASDGITPMAGLTVTATVSVDGATFVAATNSPTEVASGLYKIALADEDLAGDWIILRLTADDAVTQHITFQP